MNRLQRVWGRVRSMFARAEYTPPTGYESFAFSYGTPDAEKILPTFEQYATLGYAGNSVVFGVIYARIKLFSEARLKFRSLLDKRLSGSPALRLLERPWPGGTTGELLARMEQDASIAGNAFIRSVDDGERLERLRPDWVTIVSHIVEDAYGRQVREVLGYLYEPFGDPGRRVEYYPVEEVAHWSPIPDPLANWRGMSWMTPVIREINADVAMTAHRDAFFRNAATPNIVLKYQKKLGETQVNKIRDMVAARHTGSENAFGTMVLDEGADLTVVGSKLTDAAFNELQAAGENRIAVASGVPAIVAGLREGLAAATLANYGEAMRAFADITMRPNWRSAVACLAKLVEVPEGFELWFDTSDIAALQEGEQEQANTFQVKASTAAALITAGYTPESVASAVEAGDMTLLKHTGLYSVQLQPIGAGDDKAVPDDVEDPAVVEARALVEMVQKVYLGVGVLLTADEARALLNKAGAGLNVPSGLGQPPAPAPVKEAA